MIEWINAEENVLAVRVEDAITHGDLEAMMERIEAALARTEKLHVFVETRGLQSIELAGLPGYIARALPLFGKLDRFGRVAVVADQAWVRLGSRVESALLPFISYRVFGPEQAAEALAWVRGIEAGDG